ncbi:MAG: LysM peptidoglycan-binding domain-containing protein [Chloroflexota bacterium]
MNVRTDMKSGAACYTVQSGDNLSKIAQRFYGSMAADGVNRIYFSNMSTIGPNMNYIFPGQKLYIPD